MPKPVIDVEDVVSRGRILKQLEEKVRERLEYAKSKLETCKPEELAQYQTEVRVLKWVLSLPDAVRLDESK